MKKESYDLDKTIQQFQDKMFDSVKRLREGHDDVVGMLSLGEDYDNPDAVLQAADVQNQLYAYYAYLFHHVNKTLDKIETAYALWKSEKELKIYEKLFNQNVDAGMTANNAKPSAVNVANFFNKNVASTDVCVKWLKRIEVAKERVSQLRIMRDTVDRRMSGIQTISTLLGKCIDKGLIEPEMKVNKKFKSRSKRGDTL